MRFVPKQVYIYKDRGWCSSTPRCPTFSRSELLSVYKFIALPVVGGGGNVGDASSTASSKGRGEG
jgi:hypothetical protein